MNQPALIIIDVQKAFNLPYWGERNNPLAEENMKCLLEEWRRRGLSIFHIQHVNKENVESMFYLKAETAHFKEEVRHYKVKPLFKRLLTVHSLELI